MIAVRLFVELGSVDGARLNLIYYYRAFGVFPHGLVTCDAG